MPDFTYMTSVQIMALGGLGETGSLNCMLYETESSAIVVDCGMGFTSQFLPGVNFIIPSFDFLKTKKHKIKAIVLTHGHEDHIGSIAYLLKELKIPVYATRMTLGLVEAKVRNFGIMNPSLFLLSFHKPFVLADFTIVALPIDHSIPDAAALHLEVMGRHILHITDFKIDKTAQRFAQFETFQKFATMPLDLLLSDSTNIFSPGFTLPESKIEENLHAQISKISGRAFVCLFSSNIRRVQSLINIAKSCGRKVAFAGRSTKEYTRIAKELGHLNTDGVAFHEVEEIARFADEQILVILTGTQAEAGSVLHRLSHQMFRPFEFKKGDTLLMSSTMIPGNEGDIFNMLNRISLLGVDIIAKESHAPLHTSGHAHQEELREIIRLTQPQFFIPIHGDHHHLKKHRLLAIEEGVKPQNTLVLLNGDVLEMNEKNIRIKEHIEIGQVYISDNPKYEITPSAVKRRKRITYQGLVVLSFINDLRKGFILPQAEVVSQGLFGGEHEESLTKELKIFIHEWLKDNKKLSKQAVESQLRHHVKKFYKQEVGLEPEIIFMIHDV